MTSRLNTQYQMLLIILITAVLVKPCLASNNKLTPGDSLVPEPIFNGEIFLRQRGNKSGPIVVFVHGLGNEASSVWEKCVDELEKEYHLVSFDLPGFGRSTKANKLYSPDNYVRLIQYISDNLINKPFHLVGHSMGGAIALKYAATHPHNVRTLTLIDTAGILHRSAYTKYLAPLGLDKLFGKEYFDHSDVSLWTGVLLNKMEELVDFDPEILIQVPILRSRVLKENPFTIAGLALVLDDFSRVPQKVTAPTSIIWGENDRVAPLRTGYVLDNLIDNSALHILTDTGHVPMRENKVRFIELLKTSLRPGEIDKTTGINEVNVETDSRGSLICKNLHGVVYTGMIGTLRISNCKNVVVRNASLNHLSTVNSQVVLENVHISAVNTALEIYDSNITITSGSITGNIAIETSNSVLDIAGTKITGYRTGFIAHEESSATFSITPLSSAQAHNVLHGQRKIIPSAPSSDIRN